MKPVINKKAKRTKNDISESKSFTANSVAKISNKKMLLHQVFFWLKTPDSIEDRDKLVNGIRTLSAIEAVRNLHVGLLASTEKRDVVDTSWQVSELMFFDDTVGQKLYQDHPLHHAFIDECSHLWSRVLVYDSIEA